MLYLPQVPGIGTMPHLLRKVGLMEFIGTLGNTDWYRCVACGLEQHAPTGGVVPTCCTRMDFATDLEVD